MANAKKILAKMRNNPRDWRMEDLETVAKHFGVSYDQHGTSHVAFRHPKVGRNTVPRAIPILPVYVRDFIEFIDKVAGCDE